MKSKQPIFLNVYVGNDQKPTFSPTRKETRVDENGKETEVDVPNEQLPGQRAMNRKAKRMVAAFNRKQK